MTPGAVEVMREATKRAGVREPPVAVLMARDVRVGMAKLTVNVTSTDTRGASGSMVDALRDTEVGEKADVVKADGDAAEGEEREDAVRAAADANDGGEEKEKEDEEGEELGEVDEDVTTTESGRNVDAADSGGTSAAAKDTDMMKRCFRRSITIDLWY